MNLIDQLLYELEGESAVRDDAATARLEALLAAARELTPFARMHLQGEITRHKQSALADVELRRAMHADLLERVATWDRRAAEAPPSFADQARTRAADLRRDAEAVAAEISEYEATALRLDEVYRLLERAGQP